MKDEPKESEKAQVGVRLDAALLIEVKVLAVRQGRRLNDLVEEALRDVLKKHKVRH
jgi:predicted HicB family RNase H-like nuclease